ncbi:uncharacterized protein LOC116774960 [Danaus plexippus]|uniref:uncharacterized protein LOC116774960 n=1 Tax=Danaus plexippus TaxID=13037 RepID=UPI002AAF72B6|nr:uncharacterized protein LOC116774960 [Danaus plexippus]
MNNTPSQMKRNCIVSPKTPGGISKSLLTPCRRVGLSRNWRKGSVSPFISPLSGSNTCTNTENELKKRKKCDEPDKDSNDNGDTHVVCGNETSTLHCTPSRTLTARKRSKTLVLSNQDNENELISESHPDINKSTSNFNTPDYSHSFEQFSEDNTEQSSNKVSKVSKLKLKTKSASKSNTSSKTLVSEECANDDSKTEQNRIRSNKVEDTSSDNLNKINKCPNNLTRECMVVIQKNILKSDLPSNNISDKHSSQTSCCSDDDVPLSNLSSKDNDLKDKYDYVENEKFVKKLDKTTSVTDLKVKSKTKEKTAHKNPKVMPRKPSSQSTSTDDDDDFKIDKRTIFIKKSYNKISKPIKAKSTGSITQTDIDDLQARIDRKKKKLLAKAMTSDTEELRNLIKKWQTGCQNALTELFELMKAKMPERSMAYSDILKMFKIPSDLVGYDSENDCFVTPQDKNIILSGLNLNEI